MEKKIGNKFKKMENRKKIRLFISLKLCEKRKILFGKNY